MRWFSLLLCIAVMTLFPAPPVVANDIELLEGGKLILTNGISTIEGASGGGIATWATIGGMETDKGIGATGHATIVELPDYGWKSAGVAIGIKNRVELSYNRQTLDTRDAGTALGIGQGYTFEQDVFAAKLRLLGDVVYDEPHIPQISIAVQHKRSDDGPVLEVLGANKDHGTDFAISATKLVLSQSLLVSASVRYTAANQNGLLGFGNASEGDYSLQVEGSLGYQLSRRAVVGVEFRSKPDNLGLGEDDWFDVFAAYAVTDNLTLAAAYTDLGSIATFEDQRGVFLSAQLAF